MQNQSIITIITITAEGRSEGAFILPEEVVKTSKMSSVGRRCAALFVLIGIMNQLNVDQPIA